MARIVEFASYGAPEVLEFKDVPDPQPAAGEVRIRVEAIGLNRAESMWRHGEYIETANLPARLGYEAAGTVDALGEGVAGFEIGEPVIDRTFRFDEIVEAHRYMEASGQFGKIVATL